jgi:ATP adenylyltransferase
VGSLDQLWAGWRAEFVSGSSAPKDVKPAPQGGACVFCNILASGLADEDAHIVWRHPAGTVFAILNAYPYSSGHLMVMPVRHVGELDQLEAGESGDFWEAVQAAVQALKVAYNPEGVNLGANLGRAAGAGVPGHLHMHVVPRWVGDTNFMTAVADARVIPEGLSQSGVKLRGAWPRP